MKPALRHCLIATTFMSGLQQPTNTSEPTNTLSAQQFVQKQLSALPLLPAVLNTMVREYYGERGDMNIISESADATPFRGQIVVYEASAYYFTQHTQSFGSGDIDKRGTYRIGNNLCAGYVKPHVINWDSGQQGYEMARLLWKKAIQGACALISEQIALNENGKMFMRLANDQEKAAILEAIEKEEAEFDYMIFCKDTVLSLLRKNK